MGAIDLGVDTMAVAVSEGTLAAYFTVASVADKASLAGRSTGTTMMTVGAKVHTETATVSESCMAGYFTKAVSTKKPGSAAFATNSTVVSVG